MTNTKNGSNQGMVPEARAAMDRFKMEAAADLGCFYCTEPAKNFAGEF